jgi:hypothetical protein
MSSKGLKYFPIMSADDGVFTNHQSRKMFNQFAFYFLISENNFNLLTHRLNGGLTLSIFH